MNPIFRFIHHIARFLQAEGLARGVCAFAIAAVLTSQVSGSADAEERYAAFRVVRAKGGEPSAPTVILPEGYAFLPGERYHVASRAEYYTFVRGPEHREGIPVAVRWPGVEIAAVVAGNERLEFRRDAGDDATVTFRLPVGGKTPNACQPTLQVWSYMETPPGMYWRIEHNDPDRAAGPWTTVPWPKNQAASVIHWLFASDAILRDSGLAEAAAAKGHFYALMGFETNNTLHPDNPPHWHFTYYAGDSTRSPAYLPHFWLNGEGKTFYNGMDVTGQGRQRLRAGDPGEMYDFAGNLVVTLTIREDGGLDVLPPAGRVYSIVAGPDGSFLEAVTVERDGEPWLAVRTRDDVRAGELHVKIDDLQTPANSTEATYRYDPLTGVRR